MIKLRKVESADIPLVQKYASDPAIDKTSFVPSPYPDDGATQWYKHIETLVEGGVSKVYVIEHQGDFAGIISLNKFSLKERRANIDYWVQADRHGKGVASNAVTKVIELATKLGIENYYSGCLERNIGSQKVLLNSGFTLDETTTFPDGKFEGEQLVLFSKSST